MRGSHLVLWGIGVLAACQPSGDVLVPSTVATDPFDGEYVLIPEASFGAMRQDLAGERDAARRAQLETLLQMMADRFTDFRVRHGVIRSGTPWVQEFSLTEATIDGSTLRGRAVFHEDVGDPGDASEIPLILRLRGDTLEFVMLDEAGQAAEPLILRRTLAVQSP